MVSRRDGNRNLWSDLRCSPRRSWNSKMSVSTRRNVQQQARGICMTLFAHHAAHTCTIARVFTKESNRNDFFIARLRGWTIRRMRGCTVSRRRHTRSEDVVWKIGSSNCIISFDSMPKSSPRLSARSYFDIDIRIFLARDQIFQ